MTSPPELSDAEAATIAAAFDLGDVLDHVGPTGRGELGFVFRLTTTRGTWAVKRLISPQLEAEVREDVEFVAAARSAGVPTPAMLTTRSGAVLLDLPAAQVRITEWVDLSEVDPTLNAEAVGAALGQLHRTPFRGTRGLHPWYREPVGAQRWGELLVALTDARAPFADDLAGLREDFIALEQMMVDPADPQTCHRDLFPENLRGTVDGSVCIIDWDNHGLAGASQEMAFVVWGFAGGLADRVTAIVESYRACGGPGRVHSPGDFTMLIAVLGHINERACTHWLMHSPGDPERERLADLFGETVADPLTRSVIADLLDAVGSSARG
ncbi:Ser/Thr protein kinase RdoA (MazF antagonist) [Nakamurella sp. UYEF19]|uniref:phosphotransferase enzyme family protein n=1 Tax=Nakamurella sp. UYEF19 TaxID=1756392 RepID=UPI003397CF4C